MLMSKHYFAFFFFEVTDEAAAFIKEENGNDSIEIKFPLNEYNGLFLDFEVEETEIPASSDTELPKNTESKKK